MLFYETEIPWEKWTAFSANFEKKSLCFPPVARVFAPLSATCSLACEQALHLGDIVKSTRPRGTREETRHLKPLSRHVQANLRILVVISGIEQHQWDMDWGVSWLRPDRPLKRLPRKGTNSRKASPHWLRKTKKITLAKEFLEIRYSWLLFNFFLGVWSLDETIFLLIYASQVLYITYHIHCQFLVKVAVVGAKGGLLGNFDTLMGIDSMLQLNQFHWKPGN